MAGESQVTIRQLVQMGTESPCLKMELVLQDSQLK